MKAFWRKNKQLTWNEQILLDKCLEAHALATHRDNASSQIIKASYQCNGQDFLKAVASGLGSMGGMHAPIAQAYDVLAVDRYKFESGAWVWAWDGTSKVPGWGSSFVKGRPDPIVENAMLYVDTGWPDMGKRIEVTTDMLHANGKNVFPNMAGLTAATAVILGLPKELSPVLLLQGRALAWAEICHDISRQPSQEKVRNNGEGI